MYVVGGDYGRDINVSVYEGRVKFSKPKSTSSKTYLTGKIRGFLNLFGPPSQLFYQLNVLCMEILMPKRAKQNGIEIKIK